MISLVAIVEFYRHSETTIEQGRVYHQEIGEERGENTNEWAMLNEIQQEPQPTGRYPILPNQEVPTNRPMPAENQCYQTRELQQTARRREWRGLEYLLPHYENPILKSRAVYQRNREHRLFNASSSTTRFIRTIA